MKIDELKRLAVIGVLCGSAAIAAACAGGERKEADEEKESAPAASQPAEGGAPASAAGSGFSTDQLTPESGRKVIIVQAMTDEQGNNRFEPKEFEVHKGDVIRYTLKSGVHNVHFVADSNRSGSGFPAQPSDLLLGDLQLGRANLEVRRPQTAGIRLGECAHAGRNFWHGQTEPIDTEPLAFGVFVSATRHGPSPKCAPSVCPHSHSGAFGLSLVLESGLVDIVLCLPRS